MPCDGLVSHLVLIHAHSVCWIDSDQDEAVIETEGGKKTPILIQYFTVEVISQIHLAESAKIFVEMFEKVVTEYEWMNNTLAHKMSHDDDDDK